MSMTMIGDRPNWLWAAGFAVGLSLLSAVPSSISTACENFNPGTPVRVICAAEVIEPAHGHDKERAVDWWQELGPRWLQATAKATEAPPPA